ncbi:MAG: hypothetical protein US51_C0032G0002 [Microgenomates group bacterium GW2011_GWA2_37_6]|nr:MAG: hypothetical protein US51_C0032G0002 [Microgenomates group bacterium GW2011_GWA2_37_6]
MAVELSNGNSGAEGPLQPSPLVLQEVHTLEDAQLYVRQQRNTLWQSLKRKQPRGVINALAWGQIVNELFAKSVIQHSEYDQEEIRGINTREDLVLRAMLNSLGNPGDLSTEHGSIYLYEAQASYARSILERLKLEGEMQDPGIPVFMPDSIPSAAKTGPVES